MFLDKHGCHKISICQVNTTREQGIKQLRISFSSIFLLFSNESSLGHILSSPVKSPGPRLLMTAMDKKTLLKIWLNPALNLTTFQGTGP